MGQTGQATAPPGWYHDGTALRWWDGTAWGPYAPPPVVDPVEQGKALAAISHLGFLACWFVLPLVIRIAAGKDNAYVRHHATEALNFMICASAVYLISMVLAIASFFAIDAGGVWSAGFLAWPLLWGLQIAVLVFSIIGVVRAAQGVWWRYPVSIRFVPGARPPTVSGGPDLSMTRD
jgi:uncharacterized Tic20 family protein